MAQAWRTVLNPSRAKAAAAASNSAIWARVAAGSGGVLGRREMRVEALDRDLPGPGLEEPQDAGQFGGQESLPVHARIDLDVDPDLPPILGRGQGPEALEARDGDGDAVPGGVPEAAGEGEPHDEDGLGHALPAQGGRLDDGIHADGVDAELLEERDEVIEAVAVGVRFRHGHDAAVRSKDMPEGPQVVGQRGPAQFNPGPEPVPLGRRDAHAFILSRAASEVQSGLTSFRGSRRPGAWPRRSGPAPR